MNGWDARPPRADWGWDDAEDPWSVRELASMVMFVLVFLAWTVVQEARRRLRP